MLGVVGSNLTIFKLEPTTPNMSQHVATRWPNTRNMLRPTMLRYVALTFCDRLAGALGSYNAQGNQLIKICSRTVLVQITSNFLLNYSMTKLYLKTFFQLLFASL